MNDLPRHTVDEFLGMLADDYWKRCIGRNLAMAGALMHSFRLGRAFEAVTYAIAWHPNANGFSAMAKLLENP